MARRAPVLPVDYNPVGDRLRRLTLSPESPATPVQYSDAIPTAERPSPGPEDEASVRLRDMPRGPEPERIPEVPTGRELKAVSVRFRCTPSERKKWHELTRNLSGDHNNLSHFVRAAMLLFDHAHDQLVRLAPEIQRLRKPATTNVLGIVLYEQRLAGFLYDAIRNSGRPKP